MALILAAGLGITGIAMTTQAAEMGTNEACPHEHLTLHEYLSSATYHDYRYHYAIYGRNYICDACGEIIVSNTRAAYEDHDFEQIYYHDGKVESVCLDCHYSYYW